MYDTQELQKKFSETYRKISKDETDDELKNRHRQFYHLGKYLRECVECFGMEWGYPMDRAPLLYHGLDKLFAFSSLKVRVNGPLSMTTEFAVALNFSTKSGVILSVEIESNCNGMSFNQDFDHIGKMRIGCFDCQYLSDYPAEREIFSIGGNQTMRTNTIIEQVSGINYRSYISALNTLTLTFTDAATDLPSIICNWRNKLLENKFNEYESKEQAQIAYRLLAHELWRVGLNHEHAYEYKSCPKYFKDLLHSHFQKLTTITFTRKSNMVLDVVFKYDNDWIKLDLLYKVFPNIEGIVYGGFYKDMKWFEDCYIMENVLHFVESRRNNEMRLRSITVRINPDLVQEIGEFIQPYIERFNACSWQVWCLCVNPFRLLGVDETPLINAYSGLNDEGRELLIDAWNRADEQLGFSVSAVHDAKEAVLAFCYAKDLP